VFPKQIHHKISCFKGFDSGTKSKLCSLCGLVRGNLQLQGIVDLFSESKISQSNFLMDVEEKSTTQLQNGQTIYIEFALFEIHKISN
jgi:hypothetical protein